MSKVLSITRRELKAYFDSPIAYIFIVAFLLVSGWLFFSVLFIYERADMRDLFSPYSQVLFFTPAMLFIILAPAITMRLVAEERKSGTIELITTMPVTNAEVLLGKFLAAWLLAAIALSSMVVYAISVSAIGQLDWGPVLSGYVGMLLFAAALLAIGLMCSTWTDNQIVALIIAFFFSAGLYFVYELQFFIPGGFGSFFEWISVSTHLGNAARGVIDSRDVLYYLTLTAAALFVAERSLARQQA